MAKEIKQKGALFFVNCSFLSTGVVRGDIQYLPNRLILRSQDRSLALPPHASSLVQWTVPDIITPIDQLWTKGRQKQSTTGRGGALFSGGSKDRVSIAFLCAPGKNKQLISEVWAQPHCIGKMVFQEFCFKQGKLSLCRRIRIFFLDVVNAVNLCWLESTNHVQAKILFFSFSFHMIQCSLQWHVTAFTMQIENSLAKGTCSIPLVNQVCCI